jgi:hypothetical protein
MFSFLLVPVCFLAFISRIFAIGFRIDTMTAHDFKSCAKCCEGFLCTDCESLETDSRLSSMDEMEHGASQAKESALMTKWKLMMRIALRTDSRNPDSGVFIEKMDAEVLAASLGAGDMEEGLLRFLVDEKELVMGKAAFYILHPFSQIRLLTCKNIIYLSSTWMCGCLHLSSGRRNPRQLLVSAMLVAQPLIKLLEKTERPAFL